MPHELVEWEEIVKKAIYNPRVLIATVFSAVEEILKFDDITGTLYMQLQVVNIVYFILHKTCKFGMAICKWNPIPSIQKTWLRFKQIFRTYHWELRETSNLTVEDAGMHHAKIVRDVVAWLQKALQQDQAQMETPAVVQEPVAYVANAVQNTHK